MISELFREKEKIEPAVTGDEDRQSFNVKELVMISSS